MLKWLQELWRMYIQQNDRVAKLEIELTNLTKEVKIMGGQLDNLAASESALEGAVGAFLNDANRVLADLLAANAKLAGGTDVSAEAAAIQAKLDALTASIKSADASIDASDPAAPTSTPPAAPAV